MTDDAHRADHGSKSEVLRARLASVGIVLDEPPRARSPAPQPSSGPAPIDRIRVRAILVARGAPRQDRDWLAASCPSVAHAEAYKPPSFNVMSDPLSKIGNQE